MERTKASARAEAQQRRARETYDIDSEEEERPSQRPRLPPARATPASPVTKPVAADGTVWDIEGDWIVTTNDEYKPGPYKWSVFDAGDAVYANFALPSISGILRLDKTIAQLGPPRRTKSKFSWRGRESDEGRMCTDWDTQTGELVFKHVEGGFMLLEGSYSGPYGGCRFVGQRVAKQPSKTENKWNFYTYERYEAERRGRWR